MKNRYKSEIKLRQKLISELIKAEDKKELIIEKLEQYDNNTVEYQDLDFQLNYINGYIAGVTLSLANQK
jgi:hypothetical protein